MGDVMAEPDTWRPVVQELDACCLKRLLDTAEYVGGTCYLRRPLVLDFADRVDVNARQLSEA